ncbi:MAG: intradiol ring-cleavage dioxygenase [Nitrospirae bacterium]|nr:intradiol ring-cleavage dioxygenase [Nitrospirota bacterium]
MRASRCCLILAIIFSLQGISAALTCKPTEPDELGPFYKPDAPVRSTVGKGYVLSGTVRSAPDCKPVPGAKVEVWMAGPDGDYADAYRATLRSDSLGTYRFESHIPPAYYGRPPHIHLFISGPGFRTLITQHYPEKGKKSTTFDIVLVPEEQKP